MKLTFIWQGLSSFEEAYMMSEYEWITELFKPLVGNQVFERDHRTVLDDCLLIDSYPRLRSKEYYENFRGKNAWLFHRADETFDGGYEVYKNFRGVFRTYWCSFFDPSYVMQLPLGFSNGLMGGTSHRIAAERHFLWSFLGEGRKSTRPDMLKSLDNIGPSFVHITDQGSTEYIGKAQYKQILCDSVFVPCCMGNVNLDSYRVYEALECGAVPILERRISLDYFRNLFGDHPIPTFSNWNHAARFLKSIQTDHHLQDEIRLACSEWWEAYKKDLTQRLHDRVAGSLRSGNSIRWHGRIPGAGFVELMRHHSLSALARRAQRQFIRMKGQRPWRQTSGA
jgi:hypothetical protein